MKINWGTSIVIAFGLFIAFILYFIISMSVNKKYDHDFVTEDYYKKELAYQEMKEKIEKTESLQMSVQVYSSSEGVWLTFPDKITEEIFGTVSFYRPSDQKRDFRIPLNVKDKQMLIPMHVLSAGRWNVDVSYTVGKEEFLSTEKIDIKE